MVSTRDGNRFIAHHACIRGALSVLIHNYAEEPIGAAVSGIIETVLI